METIKTDPFLTRQYITARVLKRIVATLISDVLTSGITSWDKVLSKALSLVLQAALVARAGDMARSQAYEARSTSDSSMFRSSWFVQRMATRRSLGW